MVRSYAPEVSHIWGVVAFSLTFCVIKMASLVTELCNSLFFPLSTEI